MQGYFWNSSSQKTTSMRYPRRRCTLPMLWHAVTSYVMWYYLHKKSLKIFSHSIFTSPYALWDWLLCSWASHNINIAQIKFGRCSHLVDLPQDQTLSLERISKGSATPSPWYIWHACLNKTIVPADWYSSTWIASCNVSTNHAKGYHWSLILGHLAKYILGKLGFFWKNL